MMIAHRGASAVAPEGTRAAIRQAVCVGADMIELDVQMTRDDRLVIFHDERLERTTNGAGRIADTRYAELARLDAGGWFHPRFTGERVLLVSQLFRLLPRWMGINLELKRTRRRRALLTRLLRLVRSRGVVKRLLVSSVDQALLRSLIRSRLARALICHADADRSLAAAIRLGCAAWHPAHHLVTPIRVRRAHAAGLQVHAWTVDEVRRATQLIGWGVDGLFTNHPARLLRALRAR